MAPLDGLGQKGHPKRMTSGSLSGVLWWALLDAFWAPFWPPSGRPKGVPKGAGKVPFWLPLPLLGPPWSPLAPLWLPFGFPFWASFLGITEMRIFVKTSDGNHKGDQVILPFRVDTGPLLAPLAPPWPPMVPFGSPLASLWFPFLGFLFGHHQNADLGKNVGHHSQRTPIYPTVQK